MSWKADKFQPLRDRAEGPRQSRAELRRAKVQAVTHALRDEPLCEDTPIFGNNIWRRNAKHWGKSLFAAAIEPSFFDKLVGNRAHALILDDILGYDPATHDDHLEATSITARAIEMQRHAVEHRIQAQARAEFAKYKAHLEEARQVAEITRELRDEPEPDPFDRPMRFSYGFNPITVAQPSTVIACDGI